MSERDLLLDEFQKRDALQAANEEARKNDGVRTQAQAKLERDLQAKMREQGVRLSRSETRDLLRQAAQRSAEDAGATAVGKDSKRGVSTPKEFEEVKRRKTKVDVLPGFVAQRPEAADGERPMEGYVTNVTWDATEGQIVVSHSTGPDTYIIPVVCPTP